MLTAPATRALRGRGGLRLLVALLSVAVGLVAYASGALRASDLETMNARFAVRGAHKPRSDIVIVQIDDHTFTRLGVSWPFCYALDGRLIGDVAAAHPSAIAYDIVLDTVPHAGCGGVTDEKAFVEALPLSGADPTVFAFTADSPQGRVSLMGASESLIGYLGARAGSTLEPTDPGGVYRRVAYQMGDLRTFAVATAEVADRHPVTPKIFGGARGTAWIDYAGGANSYPSVNFAAVIDHEVPASYFRDKVVVVGVTAPTVQDIHATPIAAAMSGVQIEANEIATVLGDLPLRSVSGVINVLVIVLLGSAVPLLGAGRGRRPRASPLWGAAASIGFALVLAGAFLVAAQIVFDSGRVLSVVYALLALALSAVGSLAVDNGHLQGELRARIGELEQSRSRVLDISLRERQGIERDLHDGAQQRFVSLAITLGLLERRLSEQQDGRPLLASAREQLDLGLVELRELARGIHPAVLTDRGLAAAIQALADRAPLQVRVLEVPDERLPAHVEIAAYYVVAESLTNTAKHANAHAASVRITHDHLRAVVEVGDDGVGGADPTHGSGLRGLVERLAAVDGRLRVDSPHGAGTRIHAEIPYS